MLKLWPILAQFTAPELWVQVEYLVRIFVAACLGLLIGSERKNRNKSAGIRTHVIVALGAALIMVVSKYGFMDVEKADAARVAAQVVSGIGFLGAGTIIVTGANQVKGLTTAAALWVNAAVGIAIGSGFYFGAVSATILVCFSSEIFRAVDRVIIGNAAHMKICIEGMNEGFLVRLLEFFKERDIRVSSVIRTSEYKWYKKDICVIMELELKHRQSHNKLLKEIQELEGLRFVEEV